jgi:hypothetical protein
LNVHGVSDVRQIEIHAAEPLVPDPSPFQIGIGISNLKSHKWPGSDEIPAELIHSRSVNHKPNTSTSSRKELPQQWKYSIIAPVHMQGDKLHCNTCQGMSLL